MTTRIAELIARAQYANAQGMHEAATEHLLDAIRLMHLPKKKAKRPRDLMAATVSLFVACCGILSAFGISPSQIKRIRKGDAWV